MARQKRDTPWLERRSNGVWYALWYDAGQRRTRRESMETKDAVEATNRFARFITEGSRRSRIVGNAGVMTEQVLDWYDAQHVQPNVVDKVRARAAITHLKAYFTGTPISEIDIPMTRAYAEVRRRGATNVVRKGRGRQGQVGTDATIRRELVVLVAAANHAARWKRIGPTAKPPTPMPVVELPSEAKKETGWLTKQQLAHAFATADGQLLDFCKLAYYWAARRRSVERMLKVQVNLQHGYVDLHPPGAPVTKKRRPKVPIYPEIRPTVERLMATSSTEYLFGTPRDFYASFVDLMADLGIKAHPHMLRHSRASHMLMDGENPYKVAKLLGDTIATVEKTYAHATTDYLKTDSTIEEVA